MSEHAGQHRIAGVEIFSAGTHRGKPYSAHDLAEIVRNFHRFSAPSCQKVYLHVPAVIGHEESQQYLERTDLPAAGWVTDLWRDGESLFADFDHVPLEVARLVEGKTYRMVSAEIYDEPPDGVPAEGKMLRRVAFLGADIPEVKGLAEIPTPEPASYSEGATLRFVREEAFAGGVACFSEVRRPKARRHAEEDDGPEHEPGESVRYSTDMQKKGKPPRFGSNSRSPSAGGRGARRRLSQDQTGLPEGHSRLDNDYHPHPDIVPNRDLQHDATPDADDYGERRARKCAEEHDVAGGGRYIRPSQGDRVHQGGRRPSGTAGASMPGDGSRVSVKRDDGPYAWADIEADDLKADDGSSYGLRGHAEEDEGPEHEPGSTVRVSTDMQHKGKPTSRQIAGAVRPYYGGGRGTRIRVAQDQSGVPEGHTRTVDNAGEEAIDRNRYLQHDATPEADDFAERENGQENRPEVIRRNEQIGRNRRQLGRAMKGAKKPPKAKPQADKYAELPEEVRGPQMQQQAGPPDKEAMKKDMVRALSQMGVDPQLLETADERLLAEMLRILDGKAEQQQQQQPPGMPGEGGTTGMEMPQEEEQFAENDALRGLDGDEDDAGSDDDGHPGPQAGDAAHLYGNRYTGKGGMPVTLRGGNLRMAPGGSLYRPVEAADGRRGTDLERDIRHNVDGQFAEDDFDDEGDDPDFDRDAYFDAHPSERPGPADRRHTRPMPHPNYDANGQIPFNEYDDEAGESQAAMDRRRRASARDDEDPDMPEEGERGYACDTDEYDEDDWAWEEGGVPEDDEERFAEGGDDEPDMDADMPDEEPDMDDGTMTHERMQNNRDFAGGHKSPEEWMRDTNRLYPHSEDEDEDDWEETDEDVSDLPDEFDEEPANSPRNRAIDRRISGQDRGLRRSAAAKKAAPKPAAVKKNAEGEDRKKKGKGADWRRWDRETAGKYAEDDEKDIDADKPPVAPNRSRIGGLGRFYTGTGVADHETGRGVNQKERNARHRQGQDGEGRPYEAHGEAEGTVLREKLDGNRTKKGKKATGLYTGGVMKLSEVMAFVDRRVAAGVRELVRREAGGAAASLRKYSEQVSRAEKKRGVDAAIERLSREGKLLPAEVEGIRDQLMRADTGTPVRKFSEKGRTVALSEFDLQMRLLDRRPSIFSEFMKQPAGAADADGEREKVRQHYQAFSESFRRMGTTEEEMLAAFEARRKRDPHATAEKFLNVRG